MSYVIASEVAQSTGATCTVPNILELSHKSLFMESLVHCGGISEESLEGLFLSHHLVQINVVFTAMHGRCIGLSIGCHNHTS
jgi:hypothetical protein